MQAHPTLDSAPPSAAPTATHNTAYKARRLVTDAPTRMFHWLFALSFLGAYLTAEGERWRMLHVTLGYTMAGLLAFRVLYGWLGPRQSGLGLLWRKLGAAPTWWRASASSLKQGALSEVAWRQGLNLLMALAVVLLLALVIPITLTGYATFNEWGDVWSGVWGGDALSEVHAFFGDAFLVLVLAHIALIALLSAVRRQNQALPMLTGRVAGRGPDLVKRNRVWLAIGLLAAVLAYGAWEWQQSPRGLIPDQSFGQRASGHHSVGERD